MHGKCKDSKAGRFERVVCVRGAPLLARRESRSLATSNFLSLAWRVRGWTKVNLHRRPAPAPPPAPRYPRPAPCTARPAPPKPLQRPSDINFNLNSDLYLSAVYSDTTKISEIYLIIDVLNPLVFKEEVFDIKT